VSAIYGLFSDPESAQVAVNRLRAAGVADQDITVISSEPFEAHEFGHRDRASWMFPIAAAGGVAGLAFAYWLTRTTELLWPLETGGMKIVAMWPNIIIMFELTMLFAVLSTVVTLLVTAKLPRRRPQLYDTAVSDGQILVGLEHPPSSLDAVERALSTRGGRVRTIP
jgi:hypothetical protein